MKSIIELKGALERQINYGKIMLILLMFSLTGAVVACNVYYEIGVSVGYEYGKQVQFELDQEAYVMAFGKAYIKG